MTIGLLVTSTPSGGHQEDNQSRVYWHPLTPAKDTAIHPLIGHL